MPRYRYRALNDRGEVVAGAMTAASHADVTQRIEALGLVPIDEMTVEAESSLRQALKIFNRPNAEDITLFTQDLALLL